MSLCVTLAIKEGPLSLWRDFGSSNRGIASFKRDLQTSIAFSDQVGKASTHPVKISTNTRRYLYPDHGGIWVKSNCQSSPGYVPWRWIGLSNEGGIGWVCGLLWAHKSQASVTCFTVLLSPFPEKTFCTKSHSASLP